MLLVNPTVVSLDIYRRHLFIDTLFDYSAVQSLGSRDQRYLFSSFVTGVIYNVTSTRAF